MRDTMPEIGSFLALGDSFTEGLGDPYPEGTGYGGLGCRGWSWRGWADRFAERLAAGRPGLRYANLAVRGKLVGEVAAEQVPVAVAMAPDLVSIAAGGNDLLRPRADPDALAAVFDTAVADLRAAGSGVLVFTGFDPRAFPLVRLIRGKVAAYNMHLRSIADTRDCYLVDLWSMRVLDDPREWSPDRLHLSSDGHRRVALRACEVMGVSVDEDWRDPLPPRIDEDAMLAKAANSRAARLSQTTDWLVARRLDARWAREYAVPWIGRRLRGASSGDGIPPKRPEMLPL
jgi:lysophospholipase L1-like esterase